MKNIYISLTKYQINIVYRGRKDNYERCMKNIYIERIFIILI